MFHRVQGLSQKRALEVLYRDGTNRLDPPPMLPLWIRLVGVFFGGFNLLLWIGAVFAFLSWLVQTRWYSTPPMDDVSLSAFLLPLL